MNQAGSGIGGFSGVRYQKGDGFFGRLISGSILPIIRKVLPYLGKQALGTGADIIQDIAKGEKFKVSAKKRLKETGARIGEKAMAKVKELSGSGRRRRRKRRSPKISVAFPFKKKRRVNRKKKVTKRKQRKKRSSRKKASDFL